MPGSLAASRAKSERFAHGSVGRAEQNERIDLLGQARAKRCVRVSVADLSAPRVDVGRDETSHRPVLLFRPRGADAILFEVGAELRRVGVVGAAGVGRGAHERVRKLLLDLLPLGLVARAVEKQRVVELVGEPLHDGDRHVRPRLLRDGVGDLVDGECAGEARDDGDERSGNGRHPRRHALGVAEHHGLSESRIGYENGFDWTEARALL